jgi:glycosyltransferase involved in cell wall biosynthesis
LGREQSRFFYTIALRELPRWLTEAIRRERLSVCDWGCALGDGTDLLSNAWDTPVTGVDFSDVAIEDAKKNYQRPQFVAHDFTASTEGAPHFDIVFTSNTLEHFSDPWDVAHRLAELAGKALIIMVPFEEFVRHKEHETTFLATNVPVVIGSFHLCHATIIDCVNEPETQWPGQQIILTYITRDFSARLRLALADLQTDTSLQLRHLRGELQAHQTAREQEILQLASRIEQLAGERDFLVSNLKRSEQELASEERRRATAELLASSERGKARELQQRLNTQREEVAQMVAELEQLRVEASDRNYWEARARSLEDSTSWRVTSGARALKTAVSLSVQTGKIASRTKYLRDLAKTRGLSEAGTWLWQRLSGLQGQRTSAYSARSVEYLQCFHDFDDGRFDELKTYLRERSYTGVFVMGSRHMGWHEIFKQRSHHIGEYMMERGYLVLCAMNPVYSDDLTSYIKRDRERLFIVNFDDRSIWRQIIELIAVNSVSPNYYYMVGTEPGTTFEEMDRLKELGYQIYYDFIDEISRDINPGLSEFCIDRHEAVLRDEDILLVASADNLYRKAAKHRQRNVLYAPNGVRLEDWIIDSPHPIPSEIADLIAEGKPIIGYYGNLATWMNYDYIKALSCNRSDLNIVMIGHDYDNGRGAFTESRIAELSNVHVLPAQKYEKLKFFSRFFQVGIIPFRDYELTKSVSPVKMFEYMAQGIPIVASGLEECRKYLSCLIAESADDFVIKVGHALKLKDDAAYMEQLRREAEANTWAARGEVIEAALTALTTVEPGKLLTITVPTYNMEALLPRCLDSMLPPSQLQRLEIIIVNDGSKDDSLGVARQYEARFPEVVKVIDKENGGHGSALNVGIREAKGKYFKIVDADDWLDPTDLTAHMGYLDRYDADMVLTNYMRTYDNTGAEPILYSDRLEQKDYLRDDLYRALMIDTSHLSYAHMHAITYRTALLQDNDIRITEHSFYVDQEYIVYPQKFIERARYQNIFLYRYYNGRPGQSVAPNVARKRAPQNYKILKNIIGYCDALPRGSEIRAYIIDIAYHQSWFYLTFGEDHKSKLELISWWKETNSRYFTLLNEEFSIMPLQAAQ